MRQRGLAGEEASADSDITEVEAGIEPLLHSAPMPIDSFSIIFRRYYVC